MVAALAQVEELLKYYFDNINKPVGERGKYTAFETKAKEKRSKPVQDVPSQLDNGDLFYVLAYIKKQGARRRRVLHACPHRTHT